MDGSDFDILVKWLATQRLTRVQTVRALGLGTLAALTGLHLISEEAGAKGKGKGKKRRRKKPVCTCSTAGCTQLKVTKPSKVIAQNPRCNYAGSCTTNPCASTSPPVPPSPPGCTPEPQATTCRGRCGAPRNNCNQPVSCLCPSGQECLSNGTCVVPCGPPATNAPCLPCEPPGRCATVSTEGLQACHISLATNGTVCTDYQLCASSAECAPGSQCTSCSQFPIGTTFRCIPVPVCPG